MGTAWPVGRSLYQLKFDKETASCYRSSVTPVAKYTQQAVVPDSCHGCTHRFQFNPCCFGAAAAGGMTSQGGSPYECPGACRSSRPPGNTCPRVWADGAIPCPLHSIQQRMTDAVRRDRETEYSAGSDRRVAVYYTMDSSKVSLNRNSAADTYIRALFGPVWASRTPAWFVRCRTHYPL